MITITFNADTAEELFEDICAFAGARPLASPVAEEEEPAPAAEPKAERKPRRKKDTDATGNAQTQPAPSGSAQQPETAKTPLDESNAERKSDAPADVAYKDLSTAVMNVVKVKDKPAALAILRTFAHKDGGDAVVNGPMDIAQADYARVIGAMNAAAEAKA